MENENVNVEVSEVTETATETAAVEVATPEKPRRTNVTPQKFIKVWEEVAAGVKSGEIQQSGVTVVAERLGLKLASVNQKVTRFRKEYGLDLTTMPRVGGSRINKEDLAAELAAIRAGLETETAETAE